MVACFVIPGIGIACELKRRPELREKPVALIDKKSIIAAVSEEAAKFGVKIGQKLSGARSLCRDLQTLPYTPDCYEELSHLVWNLYAGESSTVEPVSAEVCYLEFDCTVHIKHTAAQLISEIRELTGTDVHIGIGRTKLIARTAASMQNNRINLIPPSEEEPFLASIPVNRLELDNKQQEWLHKLGIKTLGDIRALPPKYLSKSNGQLFLKLKSMLKGQSADTVRAMWPPKCISSRMHFDEPMDLYEQIESGIQLLANNVAADLQKAYHYCRTISLSIEASENQKQDLSELLASPTHDEKTIYRAGLRLLQRMNIQSPIETIILKAERIDTGSAVQHRLFDDTGMDFPEQRRRVLDAVRVRAHKRWGNRALTTGLEIVQAAQVSLCTHSLGHRRNTPADVEVGDDGIPKCLKLQDKDRRLRLYRIINIQSRWRENEWTSQSTVRWVYRVLTSSMGLYEICNCEGAWSVRAISD